MCIGQRFHYANIRDLDHAFIFISIGLGRLRDSHIGKARDVAVTCILLSHFYIKMTLTILKF